MKRLLALIDWILGVPSTQEPQVPADPLYVDYLIRCQLVRRGWNLDHLREE